MNRFSKFDKLVLLLALAGVLSPCSSHEHTHSHGHHHSHGHDHGHHHSHGHHDEHHHGHAHIDDEPAKFRYSREANEAANTVGQEEEFSDNDYLDLKQADDPNVKYTGTELWMWALGSTAMISAAPVVILFFIPLDRSEEHQPRLKVLLSFASGGLLGDAFLHLIPHATSATSGDSHDHGHTHSHGHSHGDGGHSHDMGVGLWVLGGIVAFLCVEKFVRYVKGGSHSHSHGHSHAKPAPTESQKGKVSEKQTEAEGTLRQRKSTTEEEQNVDNTQSVKESEEDQDIEVAGYLNLAADFTHNFTDGLAIGASYLAGRNIGIITTITILLHEVPHEIGDFAILVKSGCSKKKAMLLQLTTAVGAMTGTLCSLMAEGVGDAATAWILPFTAGGFIYIATVAVIPELLEDTKLWQSVKEIVALLTGVYMMVLIAEYE